MLVWKLKIRGSHTVVYASFIEVLLAYREASDMGFRFFYPTFMTKNKLDSLREFEGY